MPREKTAAADYKKLMLRLPEELLEACQRSALANRRSMNAQILYVLEEWVAKEKARESRRPRKS
jgi:hypothetical protein